MLILGIESSCDETAAAVVKDGKKILSNVVATQVSFHEKYQGVVPEIASRKHTEWIIPVVKEALDKAKLSYQQIDKIAVSSRPGLVGSLLVGLSFAKGLAFSLGVPYLGVDHIRAHLYAPHLEQDIKYPFLGLIVSGGHTVLAKVTAFDEIEVMGSTIDDACGEAFDKVAKFYELGYPGGLMIDRLSKNGNPDAFHFPTPSLHKGDHAYDVSYSGLKTAVTRQLDLFWDGKSEKSIENIAASFQKAAIRILIRRVKKALRDSGLKRLVAGGGVAANSLFRAEVQKLKGVETFFPPLKLCTDNAAMIAGIAYHYFKRGDVSPFNLKAYARVDAFKGFVKLQK